MLDAMLAVLPTYPDALRAGAADCQARGCLTELFTRALASVSAGIQTKLDAAVVKVQGGDEERTRRDAAVDDAKGKMASQQCVVKEKQELLSNAIASLQTAKDVMSRAQAAQQTTAAQLEASGGRLDLLLGAKVEVDALKHSSGLDDLSPKRIADLIKILGTLGLDQSLLTALPTALSKTADSRGAFDGMVVSQLETDLDRSVREAQDVIRGGEIEKAKHAESVKAAEVSHGVACEHHALAEATLSDVQAELTQREEAVRDAERAVKDLGPELLRQASAVDAATASLQAFREGPEAAFAQLTSPPTDAVSSEAAPGSLVEQSSYEVAAETSKVASTA